MDSGRTINWSLADGFFGEVWTSPSTVVITLSGVFNNISTYANINFNYVGYYTDPATAYAGGSDITISLGGSGFFGSDITTWAVGNFPDASVGTGFAGDIFLNINSDANFLPSYAPGSAGYALAIHEIGHTLGLKHPFDDGGTGHPTLAELGVPELDVDWFTVMAYHDDYNYNLRFWDPATPMLMDVLALQFLYGKNNTTNATNTSYSLPINGTYQTIWDAGGVDEINVSGSPEGWEIQLPVFQLSTSVDTKAGLAVPTSELLLPSPHTLYWLTGDIENVIGSTRDDDIFGSALPNSLRGNSGNDYIDGGAGNDTLRGNNGNDTLNGGAGNDTLMGGTGNDTYLNPSSDLVSEALNQGTDTVRSSIDFTLGDNIERLTLTGSSAFNGTGNVLANIMTGNAAANTLAGGAGADTLMGGNGADLLQGGTGSDKLFGGTGNDKLNGGTGNDTLTGEAGADKFLFNATLGSTNVDSVTDFNGTQDLFQLDNAIFTAIGAVGAFAAGDGRFHAAAGASVAHDANDRIVYNTSTGALYYDADGTGGTAAIRFATLTNLAPLEASDIVVV